MKVELKTQNDSPKNDYCYISQEAFNSLELSEKEQYQLNLGKLNKQVTTKPGYQEDYHYKGKVYVSSDIFNFSLTSDEFINFDGTNLNLWRKGSNINLGPVIGVFVNPKRFSFYNNNTTDTIHLIAGIRKNSLCYLFSLESIDWVNSRVKGLTYVPRLNKWAKIWLPLPDVVYDRGSEFSLSQKDKAKEIRKGLKSSELNIKFINDRDYIGKWKIYKFLLNYDLIAKHLPYTVRYKSINDILVMLKLHKYIFFKSVYGKRGKQVMSIKKLDSENKYLLNYYSKGLQKVEINSKEELKDYVDRFVGDRHFIIQRGITLMKYKHRSFDLRVLLNKNIKGQWKVMRNYVKIALKEEQTLTNYSIGSERIHYSEIFPDLYSSKGSIIPTSEDIENLSINIANYIDKEFSYFGELGLDFAIDTDGKLWLLEVNTKPAKGFGLVNQSDVIAPEYKAIIDYAKFLCGVEDCKGEIK